MKVLDTAALLFTPLRFCEDCVTVPGVLREAGGEFLGEVREPREEYVKRVEEAAEELGEELSETDVQVLALALELGAPLVTDDAGVQNVACFLEIPFEGVHFRITHLIFWERRCRKCGYRGKEKTCPVCGVKTQRVPRKRIPCGSPRTRRSSS